MVQRPRGTRDFIPAMMNRRLAFENLLESKAVSHGFRRVQTPIFESLDLFTAKSGPGVVKQLYAFEDKSGRSLTLRPELTAPVMRMISEEMRSSPKPLRLSYFGQCFRYEESKKHLQLAVKLMPADPIVNDHYGDVLWKNGNKIQARYYWNYVLNLEKAEGDLKEKIEQKLIKGL